MATAPELQEPQIAAARAKAWHQAGNDALVTLEAARTWLNHYGLILFAPRAGSLGAPAPSLVEATLGATKSTVALGETDIARTLVARLVGEGSALPLNLLGGPGDLPDFLVSAQAFPFVFTLRGDKGWKRPPETSGAVKVTPLGLRVYELLAEKGAMTIAEIVPEVGREVTESAIARALGELWQGLRVLPVLQQGEGETRWELTTARFLKAVKAGANAGQPTALSALASLYLTQALVATEEEIAGFLSPLTARSRVRDVLHGLTAGRQLAEGVLNGKTVLYMPDALPDFAEDAEPDDEVDEVDAGAEEEATEADLDAGEGGDTETSKGSPTERIRTFGDDSASKDRNLRGKPVRREGSAGRPADRGDRPRREGFRSGPRSGEERRPFAPRGDRPPRREQGGERNASREQGDRPRPARPGYTKPWNEERGSRPPRTSSGEEQPFRTREDGRPPRRQESESSRPPFRRREFPQEGQDRGAGRGPNRFAGERSGETDRPQRPFRPRSEGEGRPFGRRTEGENLPYRTRPEGGRPYKPRREGEGDRPFRPRPEGSADRPYRPRPEGGSDRPFRPRPEGGTDRPFRPRSEEGGQRRFGPRDGEGSREGGGFRRGGFDDRRGPGGPSGSGSGGGRPARFGGGPRREGAGGDERRPPRRPPFGARTGDGDAPRGARPQGGFGDRKGPRTGGPGGSRPGFKNAGYKKPGSNFGGRKGPSDRPERPARKPRPEDEA